MKKHAPSNSVERARRMRREPTDAEAAMWRLLRQIAPQARWRRQVPIRHHIVDFASHPARTVVEVDGGQHSNEADAARTALIEGQGYRVLRFWNNEVLGNPEGCALILCAALAVSSPPSNFG